MRIASARGNTIGGTTAGARNVISGNNQSGVRIDGNGATGNLVQGNFIGTDVTGMISLGNTRVGVVVTGGASNTSIGGTAAGSGNLISSNGTNGVAITVDAFGNSVEGNLIGVDATGIGALGNGLRGVAISASSNTVGGTDLGAANTIAFSGGDGVWVESGTGNAILSNAIFSNVGLGIDLGNDGPTANEADDADIGPNNLQNFPEIASAEIGATGDLVIEYLVDSAIVTSTYPLLVEFFVADADGEEGQTFIASHVYVTSTAQTSTVANLGGATALGVAGGDNIVATATDADGNTSEFSFPATIVTQVLPCTSGRIPQHFYYNYELTYPPFLLPLPSPQVCFPHAELHHAPREHRLDTILLGQRGHGAGHGIHLVIMDAQRETPHLVREVAYPGGLTAQAHQPVRYGGG